MKSKRTIVLASASPRRKQLLQPHFRLRHLSPVIDEKPRRNEPPHVYVKRMSWEKWQAAAQQLSSKMKDDLMLTADTVVAQGRSLHLKASGQSEARQILGRLSGSSHLVMTSVCIGSSRPRFHFRVQTRVWFRKLKPYEIEQYLKSKQWRGKAGAYAIQSQAAVFVERIEGSLTNVIGLPLEEVLTRIEKIHAHGSVHTR